MSARRISETLCFIVMALSLHLAAAAVMQSADGAAPGDPGRPPVPGFVTGSQSLQKMVNMWEVAPDIQATAAPLTPENPDQVQEPLPGKMLSLQPVSAVNSELPEPVRPDLPQVHDLLPPETVADPIPALTTSERPRQRPERSAEPRSQSKAAGKATPKSQPARHRSAPARAAGGGSSGGQSSQVPGQSDLKTQWRNQLNVCIARRMQASRRFRKSGQVTLNMQISRNGTVLGFSLSRSSGDASLDQVAIRAAQRVRQCPAAPAELQGETHVFPLPVRLNAG